MSQRISILLQLMSKVDDVEHDYDKVMVSELDEIVLVTSKINL